MKIYSDAAITKDDLTLIDTKQSGQIKKLRFWLLMSFGFNVSLTMALFFVK